MKKYAFFLDIDGTLTGCDGRVTPENIAAINNAVAKGHYVFICTGRPYAFIQKHVLNAANWSGIISSMGAEIMIGGEFVRRKTVTEEFAKEVVAEILKTDLWSVIGNSENCIVLNNDDILQDGVTVSDEEEFTKALIGITKIDLPAEIPEKLEKLLEREMYVIHHEGYCESAAKGVSKSEGIEFVLGKINVPQSNSVAVGDSANDIDMIKYAGTGVAVDNAAEQVKAIADRVTAGSSESGVAKIINEILSEVI